MQQGIESMMKETHNLAEKNSCFREIDCNSLTQDMKDKASPLLIFIAMKRSDNLKTHGAVAGNR